MDQRIVQLSRTVEELLQASFDLLEASEHDDTVVREPAVWCFWGSWYDGVLALSASFDGRHVAVKSNPSAVCASR